jgi:glycerol-3-phosphate acyltransferase PlsY
MSAHVLSLLQMWCGRLAMMGFISSILVEFQTGQGTIQQLGVLTPSNNILAAITLAVLGGSIVGAGVTVYRGLSGKMPKQ